MDRIKLGRVRVLREPSIFYGASLAVIFMLIAFPSFQYDYNSRLLRSCRSFNLGTHTLTLMEKSET